jgi:hypothetical protein
VDEVEALLLDAVEQRRSARGVDRVPAHVRDRLAIVRLQALDRPGPLLAALGLDAMLDAAGE